MSKEQKVYVCDACKEQRVEEKWSSPVYNGFAPAGAIEFFPESIKCSCGGKLYPEDLGKYGGQAIKKCGNGTEPSTWEIINNRPRGGF